MCVQSSVLLPFAAESVAARRRELEDDLSLVLGAEDTHVLLNGGWRGVVW